MHSYSELLLHGGRINTSMIITPFSNQYSSAISTSVQGFIGFQICISFTIPCTTCMYDKVQIINDLLSEIYSGYRKINRRAYVDSFLVILSENKDRTGQISILIKHSQPLLMKTVQERMKLIQDMIYNVDMNANVFQPYETLKMDIQRIHMKNSGSYSINTLVNGKLLELADCAELQ